jgi:carbonic anhydrase/acetyltransferase-like protein (isoleucine patch superfamily)
MAVYQLDEHTPDIHPSAWIADSAQVMGAVRLRANTSVWFNAVIRGDTETITVGEGSNVQDLVVIHADHGLPVVIGKHVTVGHQGHVARLHHWR